VTREEYLRKIDALYKATTEIPFNVCVLGPGGEGTPGTKKRAQIVQELGKRGMNAYTPEALDDDLPEAVRAVVGTPDREIQLFRLSDCIVILHTDEGMGTGGEMGMIAADRRHYERYATVIVFYPHKYLEPEIGKQSLVAGLIADNLNRVGYSDREFEACSVVADCVARVENRRALKKVSSG